jgi:hypothetical protein
VRTLREFHGNAVNVTIGKAAQVNVAGQQLVVAAGAPPPA